MTEVTTTKGMFLKSIVDSVKRVKGPDGVRELEKNYGSLNFGGFKDYPMKDEIRLYQSAMKVLGLKDGPEAWREMGKLAFTTYADSLIGKTMFSLFNSDIEKMILSIGRILNTVTSGYRIETENLGERRFVVRIGNCPDRMEFYEGVFLTAYEHFGLKCNLRSKILGKDNYEYLLEWKQKEKTAPSS